MQQMTRWAIALPLMVSMATAAEAQDEMTLRGAFEGKMVTVKLDMPATSKGIDLYPRDGMPLNVRELADRMKEFGVALKPGQQVMVTKVVVKGNSHIEFQLAGGGYGTFGDALSSPSSVSTSSTGETKEERDLKAQIKEAKNGGPTRRKELEKQLRNLQQERERENSRAAAEVAQANIAREQLLNDKRAQAGSRFNIRFRDGILPYYKTPAGVMEALGSYLDFGPQMTAAAAGGAQPVSAPGASAQFAGGQGNGMGSGSAGAAAAPAPSSGNALTSLRKGLTLEEVEKLLGPASTASEKTEGSVAMLERGYKKDGMKVAAKFVNGVLVDYTIAPL